MYLVIAKNKHGLSIHSIHDTKTDANLEHGYLENGRGYGSTYHVRKFDLSQIDLDKLMKEN